MIFDSTTSASLSGLLSVSFRLRRGVGIRHLIDFTDVIRVDRFQPSMAVAVDVVVVVVAAL